MSDKPTRRGKRKAEEATVVQERNADSFLSGSDRDNDLRRLADLRRRVLQGLERTLSEAAHVEVVGASREGPAGMKLVLSVDGTPLTISASSVEVVEGDLGLAARRTKGLRGRYNRIKNPQDFTVKQLKERNLPLYWNEEWLRSELERLGSYAEIARVHGYPSPVTIASYAKRKFGIEVQKDYARKRQAVYDDFDTGDYTHYDLAQKHGVAIATVYRWLQERREGKEPTRRGRRPKALPRGNRTK